METITKVLKQLQERSRSSQNPRIGEPCVLFERSKVPRELDVLTSNNNADAENIICREYHLDENCC